MHTSRDQPRRKRTGAPSWSVAMVDDVLGKYVDWREGARAAADAYARWSYASGSDRALRFAAYTALLDQEEETAAQYAEAVTELARVLGHPEFQRGL